MTTPTSQFFINHNQPIFGFGLRLRLTKKPITPKQALSLITDGIGIIGTMFLIEYIFQQLKIRQWSGMIFLPIILIWLTIKHIEDKRGEKQNGTS